MSCIQPSDKDLARLMLRMLDLISLACLALKVTFGDYIGQKKFTEISSLSVK